MELPDFLDLPYRGRKPRRGLTHMVGKDLTISGLESMLRSLAISWTLRHEVGGSM